MHTENRESRVDPVLHLEAYRFQDIQRPFPSHFHEGYVIGLVEAGIRRLTCQNREYVICPGHLLLLQPGVAHGCAQSGDEPFCFLGLEAPRETVGKLVRELTGQEELPGFTQNVTAGGDLAASFRTLHRLVMEAGPVFAREEALLVFFDALLERYGQSPRQSGPSSPEKVAAACAFMEANYPRRVSLEEVCRCCGLSGSTLLRAFTKERGVTPYRYLQTIRVNRARELLEEGASPAQAAQETGFNDQSHFTRAFRSFIGISPAAYQGMFRDGREGQEEAL